SLVRGSAWCRMPVTGRCPRRWFSRSFWRKRRARSRGLASEQTVRPVEEEGPIVEAENRSEIERVVQLHIAGAREGDASKLRGAFHEDARIFGSRGGTRYDEPIEELIGDERRSSG